MTEVEKRIIQNQYVIMGALLSLDVSYPKKSDLACQRALTLILLDREEKK